ncbi:hypothetical protein ACNUIY_09140 [Pseudomonas aeruginosa]
MPEINQEAFQEDMNAVGVLGAIAQGMHEERDLVNQLLGQAQMADAFAKFSVTVTTSKLAYVKENKLYRALKGMKSGHGDQFLTGTWEEFCDLLGRSREQVDRDIANLRAFGEEALESMSRMGIGYRELRQWRKLPEDARSALIEAAKQGNKDAVEYLAEELIATHTKEKAALEKQVEDLRADNEALGERMARKSRELDETVHELEKTKRRIQTMKADEAEKSFARRQRRSLSKPRPTSAASCAKPSPSCSTTPKRPVPIPAPSRPVWCATSKNCSCRFAKSSSCPTAKPPMTSANSAGSSKWASPSLQAWLRTEP